MVIKESIGKLSLSKPVAEIISHIQKNGIEIIEISADHAIKVGELEMYHKDPFDRLIIAQGLVLNYPIISKDQIFDNYSCRRLW
ncbi:type II toxin-antitoxin system VapC family toxin [bacterium]|nr:type II toxin-antitoxin system VapC family toxin [bacterium]